MNADTVRGVGRTTDYWRERAERAEADRDAALDLLREFTHIHSDEGYDVITGDAHEWAEEQLAERTRAFLARVDSGTEPK